MRIIAYEDRRGNRGLGVMRDESGFVALADAAPDLPSSLIEILEREDGLDRIRHAVAGRQASEIVGNVTLKPFLDKPNAMWALALNFKTHIEETGLTTSLEFPHMFLRIPSSFVGHDGTLLRPPPEVARAYDYEGELGVVIGRAGRHIPVDRALEHVAGYTCLNEGSVREYQIHNRQFGLGKNFEASGSYGPWLMTADEFGDPGRQWISTSVNGIVRQKAPLNDMLFNVAQVISYLSAGYRLRPGDLIAMGTPGALKPAPDDAEGLDLSKQYGPFKTPGLVHMKPGDLVEIEISNLGVLRNRVAADEPNRYRPG
jgi:2-keto-4-pentenoate hydratase/2-oxohepta-3-ene-1,7-dioic acid hydratase in catechol pathway